MKQTLKTLLIIVLLGCYGLDSEAQEGDSQSWQKRRAAFEQIQSLQRAGKISAQDELKLIRYLELENAFLQTGVALDEDYGEYYASVIASVANLRNTRSIPALLGAIATGNMAIDALVEFGNLAVEPVSRILNTSTSDVPERFAATLVFSRMLDAPRRAGLTAESIRQIREVLLVRLTDDTFYERIEAIQAIVKLQDQNLVPVLQGLAQSDNYEVEGSGTYPVREAASQAVNALMNLSK